jgi:hypothetical protein
LEREQKYYYDEVFRSFVKFGWFKHIEVYALTSNHIYEDIDQMFSTWNVHYWTVGLQSIQSVKEFLS